MLFSGLKNIDFGGIGSLSGALSPQDAAAIAWDHTPFGTSALISQAEFSSLIRSALSSGGYAVVQQGAPPSGVVLDEDIVRAASLDDVKAAALRTVLSSMRGDGYYVVSPRATKVAQAPTPTVSTSAPTSAYQAPLTPAQQALSSPVTQVTQQAPNQVATSVVDQVLNVFSPPSQSRTIYRRQAHRQTPAERQRLIWIIGGFAVVFAVAMGVIASRSGE